MGIILKTIAISLAGIIAVLALLVAKYEDSGPVLGGAPPGLAAGVATTSLHAVSTTVSSLFSTTTVSGCAARIVTTKTGDITLMFSQLNSIQPSAAVGHKQVASTTVAYDCGLYGADAWRVFGNISEDINVTETR